MQTETQKHCEVLELDEIPSVRLLKTAYKRQIKKWHPDRYHNDELMERIALERTQKINTAYQFLLDLITKSVTSAQKDEYNDTWRNNQHHYWWQRYSTGFPDDEAAEIFLRSSHIVSVGYNKEKKHLYLKFIGDEVFKYFDVPEYIFYDFVFSKSHGKYAIKYIYNRFKHQKITPHS